MFRKGTFILPDSSDDFFGALATDLNLLADGVDEHGNVLADSWSCVVVNLKGDWEYVMDVLQVLRDRPRPLILA